MKILFATNNAHKLEEVKALLPEGIELTTPRECGIEEEIPETAETLEGNALQKAHYLYSRTGLNVFADDTGLEVEALGGAPGVRSARYATEGHDPEANNRLLMANLEGKDNRKAQFRTVIALIIDGKEHLFEGVVKGQIATQYSGNEGFGYDPIFIPEGKGRTFAEMSMDEKGEISHRGRATRKLVDFLRIL
ncbi:MAG: RdgB/HAM1 family non-canonical purine NTP pyrophosphatase [Rikenellaceae bacterium]